MFTTYRYHWYMFRIHSEYIPDSLSSVLFCGSFTVCAFGQHRVLLGVAVHAIRTSASLTPPSSGLTLHDCGESNCVDVMSHDSF